MSEVLGRIVCEELRHQSLLKLLPMLVLLVLLLLMSCPISLNKLISKPSPIRSVFLKLSSPLSLLLLLKVSLLPDFQVPGGHGVFIFNSE